MCLETHPSVFFLKFEPIAMILGASRASTSLISSAWQRMKHAYRPSTTSAHRTHVRAYFAFLHINGLAPHHYPPQYYGVHGVPQPKFDFSPGHLLRFFY